MTPETQERQRIINQAKEDLHNCPPNQRCIIQDRIDRLSGPHAPPWGFGHMSIQDDIKKTIA